MGLAALDHINITTQKLEETKDFFVDILGLEVGARPDFPFEGYWLYLGERGVVHLMEADGERRPSSDTALDHFAFAASDYDGMRAKLDAAGLEYLANDVPQFGIRQLFVRDPNAVTIELNFRSAP